MARGPVTRAVLVLLAVVALAACGRKAAPVPPGPPGAIIYPHVYPSD